MLYIYLLNYLVKAIAIHIFQLFILSCFNLLDETYKKNVEMQIITFQTDVNENILLLQIIPLKTEVNGKYIFTNFENLTKILNVILKNKLT